MQVYPEGKMSQHMDSMVLGQYLEFKGPKGRFTYQRNSKRAIGEALIGPAKILARILNIPNIQEGNTEALPSMLGARSRCAECVQSRSGPIWNAHARAHDFL